MLCERGDGAAPEIATHLIGEFPPHPLLTSAGIPGGIRTHDPLLRRQPLYPAELQGRAHSLPQQVRRGSTKHSQSLSLPALAEAPRESVV